MKREQKPIMKIMIDGKEIKVLNDVKIIWEGDEENSDLHLTVSHEGIVLDAVRDGNVENTSAQDIDYLLETLGS